MVTEPQREARRRNGRASKGPRTLGGKARAAQNARRHGLTIAATNDPRWSDEIVEKARLLAGNDATPKQFELARQVAAAQIDLNRVRRARQELLAATPETTDIRRLAALERYESRAFGRRRVAMRNLSEMGGATLHWCEEA